MFGRKISTVFFVCIMALAVFTLITYSSALGQPNKPTQQQSQDPGPQKSDHPHGGMMGSKDTRGMMHCREMMGSKHSGGMMRGPGMMQPMMSRMSKNSEMLKHHFTMVINNTELRSALVKLLKGDASLLQTFENLLSEARK